MNKSSFLDNPYVDITAGLHGGNKQSNEANVKVAPYKMNWREKILGLMAIRQEQGLGTTRRHAADYFGKEAGQISGRFTELKVAGLIEETGVTEGGFMVYRLPGSKNLPPEKFIRQTLRVDGLALATEALFEKRPTGWVLLESSPSLYPIVQGVPIKGIPEALKSRGLTYRWLKAPG